MANTHVECDKIELTVKQEDDFSAWYRQIVFNTKLLEHYDIAGCYIMLPTSMEIWEHIQQRLNNMIKKMNVQNVYFPMLITEHNLTKESAHIEGFKPEVVWVSKSGKEETENKLAVRPTSECAFYPTFAKLIRNFTDLPLKWNQWCNVMRWEFTSATPFIRSREFLWQEGHCAFESDMDAHQNTQDVLKMYERIYNEMLAVPVILGKKVESEKFAGATSTFTVETFIPAAKKAIQCATAHNLGQNFSKIFDIKFQKMDGTIDLVYQTSWGFTTRSIGTMIMTHSDNNGLVLPPTVAPIQIVIVPIKYVKQQEITDSIILMAYKLKELLEPQFRVHVDDSDRKPGWKFYHWEAKGIPVRIEIGPKDFLSNQVTLFKRYLLAKTIVPISEITIDNMVHILDDITKNMLIRATTKLHKTIKYVDNVEELKADKNFCCVYMCNSVECEIYLRNMLTRKPICQPLDQKIGPCIVCSKDGINTYFADTF